MKIYVYLMLVTLAFAGLSESADAETRRMDRGRFIPSAAYDSNRPDPTVKMVQIALQRRGYYTGVTSGQFVWETRDAIRRYRRNNGLQEIGKIDGALLRSLGLR